MKKGIFILISIFAFILPLQSQETEIVLWHAFDGPLKDTFLQIVEDFNSHSGSYKVVAIKKGNYKDVFEQGLETFKDGTHPHILQIYDVATLTAMQTDGIFLNVDDLMKKYHKRFDPDVYIDVVRNFYSSPNGKMMSLPWNASTGILFYNKNAFAKAGLDPEKPPATWDELEAYSKALVKNGYKGFTTAWPAAYHLEHLSCWHNLPFATLKNGFGGLATRFIFNDENRVFHISKIAEWQKNGIFQYNGRFSDDPEKFFIEEKCAILLQGANRLPLLKSRASFPIGVGFIPYWPHISPSTYNLNIGGSSFWVMAGFNEEEYRGIVQFFEYLSLTEVQAYWHQTTGYLPITDAAYYLTKKKGFYKNHPAEEIAVLEVMGKTPAEFSQGMRFGDYVKIRDLFVDHIEMALSGQLSAKEALNQAVEKGNGLLKEFEEAHAKKTPSP